MSNEPILQTGETSRASHKQAGKRSNSNPLGIARRSIWYLIRALLIVSATLGLCYAVFTEAMYISNIYIVTTEGMALRADAILKNSGTGELTQYFTEDFVKSDYMLYSGIYSDYTVDSYDYRYSIEGVSVFPWSSSGVMTYVERIPVINATANADSDIPQTPAWVAVRCRITLTKIEGRWLISNIEVLEENPEEQAKPTPDYSQIEGSVEPTIAPTARPTDAATAPPETDATEAAETASTDNSGGE